MGILETNKIFKERLSRKAGMHQLTETEIEKVKSVVLEIALDVVGLCRELHIPYMLGGGSALGAVRHGGFIPWDDDIDINIPRPHIDRLLAAVEERYADKYDIEAPLKTPGYLSSFIQIHRRGTVFREYLVQREEHCGIKLDIFVIENTYDHPLRRKIHGIRVEGGLFFLSCYRMFAWRREFRALAGEDASARRIMRIKQVIGMFFAIAPGALYRRVQKCMSECRNDASKYITIPSGRKHFFGELYERAAFMQTEERMFEGHLLSVTKDYDRYLTRLYGDYMTPPPEEEREHHVIYQLKLQGEMKSARLLSREEVQKLLVEMLDAFVSYCDKHSLRYYLVGGTLLGAVRHKGFIPWDDDIDVGMPRPDYMKFLKLVKREPVASHLAAISGEEGTLGNPYCELIHTGTSLERGSSKYIRESCQMLHLFIDIFPQDGWPEGEREAMKLADEMKRYRYLIQCGRSKLGKGVSAGRIFLKTPMVLLMRVVGYQRIVMKMIRIAQTYPYDSSRYVGAVTYGIYGVGERCLRAEVTELSTVTFEGKEYCAPGCWDKYLAQIYGDYHRLPPEEKRRGHGMQVYFDD